MAAEYPSEKEFLIAYALNVFNGQYNRSLKVEDCGLSSVEPTFNATHGYQICTLREDDYVRIFLYFDLGKGNHVHWVRVEDEQDNYKPDALGDEVFVILATISDYWIHSGTYTFKSMYCDCSGPAAPPGISYAEGGVIASAEGDGSNICYVEDAVI